MSKNLITVRLDAKLLEQIDALAEAGETTRTDIIERALASGIKTEREFIDAAASPVWGTIMSMLTSEKFLQAMKAWGENVGEDFDVDQKRIEQFRALKAKQKPRKGLAPKAKPA